jgi:hypothetical protein
MRYQSPATSAPDIETLANYLYSIEGVNGPYIYRGQVKEWSGPLIPSLYRHSISRNRIFTPKDTEYKYCLRHCGQRFIEMKPDSYIEGLVLEMLNVTPEEYLHMIESGSRVIHRAASKGPWITPEEYQAIWSLSSNPKFASLVAASGYEAALSKWVKAEYKSYVLERLQIWRRVLDELHRGWIRQLGFIQPFGFMLGLTLAQQYGFSSELLDFTSDIRIAAFFSTHDGPDYRFKGLDLASCIGSDIGVIYRLPSNVGAIKYKRIDCFDYYESPPQLHLGDLCMRFEDKSSPEMIEQMFNRSTVEEIRAGLNFSVPLRFLNAMEVEDELKRDHLPLIDAVDRYLNLYYQFGTGNLRYYRLLNLQPGAFARSRLGRQSAVMIAPDELRITKHYEPWEDEFDCAIFQAVEDIKQREGFECFYFHHSKRFPYLGEIDREYLWPSERDDFRLIISRILDPSTPQYWFGKKPVPKRIDLVSSGFTYE